MALGRAGCEVFNVGSGNEIVMRDVAKKIAAGLGKELDIVDGGERPGDPNKLVADAHAIRGRLGWEPQVDPHTGMSRAIAFYDAHRSWWMNSEQEG
jgi:nucleoside-diphosphate-sugar epimerase